MIIKMIEKKTDNNRICYMVHLDVMEIGVDGGNALNSFDGNGLSIAKESCKEIGGQRPNSMRMTHG